MMLSGGTSGAQQLGSHLEWLQMDLRRGRRPFPSRDTGSLCHKGPLCVSWAPPHPCPYPCHSPVSLQVHSLPERGREELRAA